MENSAAKNEPPTSIYFTTLNEVEEWFESANSLPLQDRLRIPREKLEWYSRKSSKEKKMQVQVIHDFKNGYQDQEDMNPMGYFPAEKLTYYFLQFPSLCDEFVYFSHHRVTVPPISWTNQCHKNGIPCLGTIIFEGRTAADFNELDRLMQKDSDGIHFKYVRPFVELCKHYCFEGYLVNIETRFSNNELASQITAFLSCLRSELKLINKFSKVVWYDAFILRVNRVKYGNGITEDNYNLMMSCDSMLCNYWWTEETLQKSIKLAGIKAEHFVGVDVWGRGSKFGNGGFEVPLAVGELSNYGDKCGLFAPAWTYEYFGPGDFDMNDAKFWLSSESSGKSIAKLVGCHNSTVYRPSKNDFIFYTNFSEGKGLKFFENGRLLMNEKWINGSLVSHIPLKLYEQKLGIDNKDLGLELYYKDAYHLGTSLKIEKLLEDNMTTSRMLLKKFSGGEKVRKKLFVFEELIKTDLELALSYKYLSTSESHMFLVVIFEVTELKGDSRVVEVLVPIMNKGNSWTKIVEPIKAPAGSMSDTVVLRSIAIEFREFMDAESEKASDWVIIDKEEKRVKYKQLSFLIGDLALSSTARQDAFRISTVQIFNDIEGEIGLRWDESKDPLYWNVIIDGKFWGTSVVPFLYLTDRPSKIRVDIVNRDGECIIGDEIVVSVSQYSVR